MDRAVIGDPVCLQVKAIALIDAAFGDSRAAIGSGDGSVRAGDLRSRQPLRPPLIAPDGQGIVCRYWDEGSNLLSKLAIIPMAGGEPKKILNFDLHAQQNVRWAPDGNALTYIEDRAGASNLWSFSLEGGSTRQLTDFKSDRIYNYVWSRDGNQLVCVRGVELSDAVLISGFK